MEKEAIYRLLEEEGIPFAVTEHPPVFTMEGTHSLVLPYPEDLACNLFVRDDKKRFYGLITVKGEGRLDLKAFQKEQGTRRLSLASPADLASFLQLAPGSVTPFGLLNDAGTGWNSSWTGGSWKGRAGSGSIPTRTRLQFIWRQGICCGFWKRKGPPSMWRPCLW